MFDDIAEIKGRLNFRRPLSLKELPNEENHRMQGKQRYQYNHRPCHVAEEGRHRHAALFGNGFDHEVRRITDISERTHKYRAHGYCQQRMEQMASHQAWASPPAILKNTK